MDHGGQMGIVFDNEGHKLLGSLFMPPGEARRPTAVLLHGLPGIEKNVDLAHALRDLGWSSLIFHYRGSWGSEGSYRFKNLPADATAALGFLASGQNPHVDPERIVLVGHSMGGWAAVLSAVNDPRAKAVAVLGGVTDPPNWPMTLEAASTDFTPWLWGITPAEMVEQWSDLDEAWNPTEQVSRLSPRPLLVIHGGADVTVLPEQGQSLFQRAGDPKEMILMPEANHSFTWHRPALRRYVLDWLDRLTW